MFGVNQRGKVIDGLTEYLAEKNATEVGTNLEEIREAARKRIEKKQRYEETRRRKQCKGTRTFTVGENVVMKNVDTVIGSNKKLIPKYRGPYVIDKILGNDRYVIRDIDGCQLTQLPYNGVVEANKIRRWVTPRMVGSESCRDGESDGSTDEEEEEDFHGFEPDDVDRDDLCTMIYQ